MLAFTGPKLIGMSVQKRRLLLGSLFFSVIIPIVRSIVPFGLHSLVLWLAFIIFLYFLYSVPLKAAFAASLLSFSLLVMGDGLVVPIFLNLLNIPLEKVLKSLPLQLAGSYLSAFFLICGSVLAFKGFGLSSVLCDVSRKV